MSTIHMSEAEAAGNFAGLMRHIRSGFEVIIESGSQRLAIVRPMESPRRSIAESIRLLDANSEKLGYTPVMDVEFAADMAEIIKNRKPRVSLSFSGFAHRLHCPLPGVRCCVSQCAALQSHSDLKIVAL